MPQSWQGGDEIDEFGRLERLGAAVRSAPDGLERGDSVLPLGDTGELERVCERLAPVRERSLNDALDPGEADRQLATFKQTGDLKSVVDQIIAETTEGVMTPGTDAK